MQRHGESRNSRIVACDLTGNKADAKNYAGLENKALYKSVG
jgi:hypothetical protein